MCSLDKRLDNILADLGSPNVCQQLNAFIKEVEAQAGKSISQANADALVASARTVKATLECP